MAVVVSVNYTAAGMNFSYMTADTDLVSGTRPIGQAVEQHDHSSTKGLGVLRVQTGTAPANAGEVRVNGDTFQWWAATAAAVYTAVSLAGTQTISGAKTFSAAVVLSDDLAVNGGDLTSTATTFNLLNATVTTLNVGGAATTLLLGTLGAGARIASSALSPQTTDGAALGTTTLLWSDLFVASGAVINFNNGNVTVTHSAGLLDFSPSTTRLSAAGLKLGATTSRLTTEPTNALTLFDGTAPVGTLTNGVSLYSVLGNPVLMDSAGNAFTNNIGAAHTVVWGTTANTITFPNAASGTVPLLNLAQTWTALQSFGTNLGGTLQTAAQPNVTSVGTLTTLTVGGFTDITAGGLRVKGTATSGGADTANVNARLVLAAGTNAGANNTIMDTLYMRGATVYGRIGFDTDTSTIAGVVMSVNDYKINTGEVYRAFFDDSDSGRLVLGGGLTTTASINANSLVANAAADLTFNTASAGKTLIFQINGVTYVTHTTGGPKIGGTALRATTEGTNKLDIFDGTAPAGTLANGISLYSTAGELRVMDAGGTATLLSPHDQKNGEWIYDSISPVTGKHLRVDMERMVKFLNQHFGADWVSEVAA